MCFRRENSVKMLEVKDEINSEKHTMHFLFIMLVGVFFVVIMKGFK